MYGRQKSLYSWLYFCRCYRYRAFIPPSMLSVHSILTAIPRRFSKQVPYRLIDMDRPSLARHNSDIAFLNEPYNPLYNPFPSRPILVHQYASMLFTANAELTRTADATLATIAMSSSNDLGLAICSSTTVIRMRGIIVPRNEVCALHNSISLRQKQCWGC